MPKFAKRFFVTAAAVLGAAILILLFINLYLQSSGVQQRIRDAASRVLGIDLQINGTSFTPWNGLVLRGISVPSPVGLPENMIEASALRIRFALFPLFERRFVITDCTLFEPKVVVEQLDNGDWLAPLPPKVPPTRSTSAEQPGGSHAETVFRGELQKFRIYGGLILFRDTKKQVILELDAVKLDATVAPDMSVTGDFYIDRAFLANYLKPRKIAGPFSWDGHVLELPKIDGSLAGGGIDASYRMILTSNPTFRLDLKVSGIMLKKLLADANLETAKTEGQLKGELQLTGDPRRSSSNAGTGHFELTRAQLKPMDFLIQLGQLLQIDELQLLKLSEAKLDFTVKDEKVWIDNLILKSENLILTGHGPIRFNRKMNLDAKLMVNQKLQQHLQGVLGKNFKDSDDPEYKELAFTVSGRIDSPKTDLLDKIIGINLGGNVGGLLKNLFHFGPAPSPSTTSPAPAQN